MAQTFAPLKSTHEIIALVGPTKAREMAQEARTEAAALETASRNVLARAKRVFAARIDAVLDGPDAPQTPARNQAAAIAMLTRLQAPKGSDPKPGPIAPASGTFPRRAPCSPDIAAEFTLKVRPCSAPCLPLTSSQMRAVRAVNVKGAW